MGGLWYKYSESKYLFSEKFACTCFNITAVNDIMFYEYRYRDPTINDEYFVQKGELLFDYVKNKIYILYTSPTFPIEEYNWVPINATDAVGFALCNECGYYGTQDSGCELFI
jgi:hypothetical protein